MIPARARFETWADIRAPHLPADRVDAMQVELVRWRIANFGIQSDELIALGVVEECGELDEAYEDSTGQRRCESCGTYRDSDDRNVDSDGIYTCADESACSAACAAKEQR